MSPTDIDAAVTRLFTLLGVVAPNEGSVVFDFHEGHVAKVRPTNVITVKRDKGLAREDRTAHTPR